MIVSTGSKALQDQLYSRDLPTVAKALKYKGSMALLKGRSNYLCLERLEQQSMAGGDLAVQAMSDLVHLRGWSNETVDGDISTCGGVAEDSIIWPLVTSTNDNCLGSDCPQYQDCFVVKARRKAMDADVVVVNHHLFLADMVVKEGGFAELIPDADVMIFDEAHQVPDIASQYFGQQLSSRQLLDLAKDITLAYRTEIRDSQQLQRPLTDWPAALRTSDCRWATPVFVAICATCCAMQIFSARCYCSMTRWNCASTWLNSPWGVQHCWMRRLNVLRSIAAV